MVRPGMDMVTPCTWYEVYR